MNENRISLGIWDVYSRRRRWSYVVMFGGAIVACLVGSVLKEVGAPSLVWKVLPTMWLVGSVATALYGSSFPCPRCGKGFGARWQSHESPWEAVWQRGTGKCVHCGLAVGEDPSKPT
jgi:hypothetical protein